ncbi:MAG: hypothetical protein F6K47_04280 [Symploca sp. SIO2E6]|nr:hypothetical protein [Symploca sp. SIO2E6]
MTKLESRAASMNFASKDLCAKQLAIEGLEETKMRELHYRLASFEQKLEVLEKHIEQVPKKLAQVLYFVLSEVSGIKEEDAAKIANHVAPGTITFPSSMRQ